MEIGNKILELRKKNNITQEQLAEKINVARQTISKWELGETSPDLSQAKELSKIFNISIDELTNNDIKNILISKVDKSNKLTKIIINILIILLLTLIITIIVLTSTIYFKEYFDVKPISSMQSIECNIDGKDYSYEVWMTNETTYILDKLITNDNQINIDTTKYINYEEIFKDIKEHVISRGGTCK